MVLLGVCAADLLMLYFGTKQQSICLLCWAMHKR